jgi:hypothetical protein
MVVKTKRIDGLRLQTGNFSRRCLPPHRFAHLPAIIPIAISLYPTPSTIAVPPISLLTHNWWRYEEAKSGQSPSPTYHKEEGLTHSTSPKLPKFQPTLESICPGFSVCSIWFIDCLAAHTCYQGFALQHSPHWHRHYAIILSPGFPNFCDATSRLLINRVLRIQLVL